MAALGEDKNDPTFRYPLRIHKIPNKTRSNTYPSYSFLCSNQFYSSCFSTQLLNRFNSIPGILPTGVTYLEFAAAGIVMQNAFGSALQSGNSIVADIDSGFLQKMLVTPMSRPAILLGRLSSDAFRVVIQTAIILALGYALGALTNNHFYVITGIVGILLIFFTLAFFGLAWSGISLAYRHENKKFRNSFRHRRSHHIPTTILKPSFVPS